MVDESTSKIHPIAGRPQPDGGSTCKQTQSAQPLRDSEGGEFVEEFRGFKVSRAAQSIMKDPCRPNNNNNNNIVSSSSGSVPAMTISNDVTLNNDVILNVDVIMRNQFNCDDNPFAEYMWMENEEEFNRQVEEQLWEEEFMDRCFQEMLEEEEEWEWFIPSRDLPLQPSAQLQQLSLLGAGGEVVMYQDVVVNSNLNPNAKEFTPGIQRHVI